MTYEHIITMLFAQLLAYAVLLHMVMTGLKRQVTDLRQQLEGEKGAVVWHGALHASDDLRECMLKDYETLIKTR